MRDCLVFADSKVEGFNFYSATTLYALLKKHYGCVLRDSSPSAFSKLLPNIGTRVHTQLGYGYWVKFVGEWIWYYVLILYITLQKKNSSRKNRLLFMGNTR